MKVKNCIHKFIQTSVCMNYKNVTVQKKNDVSEGIGINKISASKECMLCPYW